MSRRIVSLCVLLILLASLLAGCGATPQPTTAPATAAPTQPPASGAVTLRIMGPATELILSEADLKAMPTLDVPYTGKDGTTTTYTGVLLTGLLESSGVVGAPDLTLIASDGYTYTLASADYANCADCIVAFDPQGGLRSVLPALGSEAQVKNLVEIFILSAAPAEGALKVTGKVVTPVG